MVRGLWAPAVSPPGTYGQAMAYDAATGDVVMFGGVERFTGTYGGTWTWNGSA